MPQGSLVWYFSAKLLLLYVAYSYDSMGVNASLLEIHPHAALPVLFGYCTVELIRVQIQGYFAGQYIPSFGDEMPDKKSALQKSK